MSAENNNISSMTGFGSAEGQHEGLKLEVEIKVLNGRHLDITYRSPTVYSTLENQIRTLIKQKINRGRASVFLRRSDLTPNIPFSLTPSFVSDYLEKAWEAAGSFVKDEDRFKEDLLVRLFSSPDWAQASNIEELSDEEEVLLSGLVKEALEDTCQFRLKEGASLSVDIESKAKDVRAKCAALRKVSAESSADYRDRLLKLIEPIKSAVELDEQRLATELAVQADRADITEELVRIDSHTKQLSQTLQQGGLIGRKLEFIVQELFREFSTVASKAIKPEQVELALEAKSELEKIREQALNLE